MMDDKDLERAFGSVRKDWTESQRRVEYYIKWLEENQAKLESKLTLFQKAAADCWLQDNLHND